MIVCVTFMLKPGFSSKTLSLLMGIGKFATGTDAPQRSPYVAQRKGYVPYRFPTCNNEVKCAMELLHDSPSMYR